MLQKQNISAFTLVELIVVITIVGILSTIGFVSYSGYLTGARDSNRISQMIKLSDSLQVYGSTKSLPLPDNSVTITASGTTIAYQGEVGVDVLETIDYTNGGADPKDDSYYSYMLTKDRNSMQLMAMMEEEGSTSLLPKLGESYAVNYEDRFPKVYGTQLGILTYDDNSNLELKNTPLEKISGLENLDIATTTTVYTSHINNESDAKISGTGTILISLIGLQQGDGKAFACNEIYKGYPGAQDGIYIGYARGKTFNILCQMKSDGGWTLVDGVSNKFGQITPTQVGGVPNIDNYSMPDDLLFGLAKREKNIFQYSIQRGSEDLRLYIETGDIKGLASHTDQPSADKNASIESYSWVTFNGGDIVQNRVTSSYTRLVLRSPGISYGHMKTYGGAGPHSWWVGRDGSYFGEYYLNEALLDISVGQLPTFGGLFSWDEDIEDYQYLVVNGVPKSSGGNLWNNYPILSGKGIEGGLWIQ